MQSDRLRRDLVNIRNQAQRVVINPSNSLSIDDPDELILIDGMLAGIFYPTKTEISDPKRMLRRILNSKLTYASTLKTVLIAEENNPILDNTLITTSVDTFIHAGDANKLSRRLKDPQMNVPTFSSYLRMQAVKIFSRNVAFHSYMQDRASIYEPISLNENPYIEYDGKSTALKKFYISKFPMGKSYGNLILNNYGGKFISLSKSLQSFLTESFFLRFVIEGKEISGRHIAPHDYSLFNSDLSKFDEEDLIKICFAGFVPICASSENECVDLIITYTNEKRAKRH